MLDYTWSTRDLVVIGTFFITLPIIFYSISAWVTMVCVTSLHMVWGKSEHGLLCFIADVYAIWGVFTPMGFLIILYEQGSFWAEACTFIVCVWCVVEALMWSVLKDDVCYRVRPCAVIPS